MNPCGSVLTVLILTSSVALIWMIGPPCGDRVQRDLYYPGLRMSDPRSPEEEPWTR